MGHVAVLVLSLVMAAAAATPSAPAVTPSAAAATPSAPAPSLMWANSIAQLSAQQKAALDKGKALEVAGDFQGAYDVYRAACYLPPTQGGTRGGYGVLTWRALAVVFLRPSMRLGTGDPGPTHLETQGEAALYQARAQLKAAYRLYKIYALPLLAAIDSAAKAAESKPDKAAYQARVGEVMDLYASMVREISPYDRASVSFQQILEAVRNSVNANKSWDTPDRNKLLKSAYTGAGACQELMNRAEFGDDIREEKPGDGSS